MKLTIRTLINKAKLTYFFKHLDRSSVYIRNKNKHKLTPQIGTTIYDTDKGPRIVKWVGATLKSKYRMSW